MKTGQNSTDLIKWREDHLAPRLLMRSTVGEAKCQRARGAKSQIARGAFSAKTWGFPRVSITDQVCTIISSQVQITSTPAIWSQGYLISKLATGSWASPRSKTLVDLTQWIGTQTTATPGDRPKTFSKNRMEFSRICTTLPTDSEKLKFLKHEF